MATPDVDKKIVAFQRFGTDYVNRKQRKKGLSMLHASIKSC